jgi:CHAD domain-containing protein
MLSHEAGTRLGEDIEELHDMRVATRKMRSAFFVFGDVYQPKITQFYQKELRKVGRALGRVRDLDVLIANGQGFQKSQPPESKHEIGPLLTYWELELGENRHGLLELLDHPRYLKFKESFNEFLQTPGLGIQTQDSSTANQLSRHIVPTLIYTRLANVMSYDSRISMATIPELHALRIECKLLRYTLEFFKEILGAEVLEFIAEIKKIQDHLGELNDAQVACQLMAAFLERFEKQQAKVPLNERSSPSGVVAYQSYCYGIRHQKMRTFPEVWESFKRIELRQRLARSVSVL